MRSVANRLHRGSGRLPICRILPAKNPAHQSAAAPHVRQQSEMTADSQTLPPTGQSALVSGIRQPFLHLPGLGNAFPSARIAGTLFSNDPQRSQGLHLLLNARKSWLPILSQLSSADIPAFRLFMTYAIYVIIVPLCPPIVNDFMGICRKLISGLHCAIRARFLLFIYSVFSGR